MSRFLDTPRSLLFSMHARRVLARLSHRLAGGLETAGDRYTIEPLTESARDAVETFLRQELSERERINAGVKRGTVNFRHPCFAYFGITCEGAFAALFIVQLFGRGVVEDYIAVGPPWRKRGLMGAVLARFNDCCRELAMTRRVRINRANDVMQRYYIDRGYALETVEGECYVLELRP